MDGEGGSGEVGGEGRSLRAAEAFLAANRVGTLCFDDRAVPIRFVCDNATGRLIMSVPVAALLSPEVVLWSPEESHDAMQLLLSLEEVGESGATDRWMAFHGEPEHVRWAAAYVDSARLGPWVFDGDAMMRPNALSAAEPALVRRLNEDRRLLRAVCEAVIDRPCDDPVAVGVDPDGVHVRLSFGVLRLDFDRSAADGEDASAKIESMLSSAR